MSKLLDQIQSLMAMQDEAQLVPTRRGGGAITIPCDGSLVTFPVVVEGEANTGFSRVTSARLISARLAKQRYAETHDNYRADENDPTGWQHVIDLTFAARATVGLLVDEQEILLPMALKVLPAIGSPIQFIYGHHQGVHVPGAEALREQLVARGWVVRPELEGVDRRRITVWNLQTRGANSNGQPNVQEQTKLTNGAIEVAEIVARSTYFPREDGTASGFKNFVEADLGNYERWLTQALALGEDATEEQTRVIHQGLTSLTGARTQTDEQGKLVTYLDRAGVAEFTLVQPPAEEGGEPVRVPVSFWESAEAAAEGNQTGMVVPDNDRF